MSGIEEEFLDALNELEEDLGSEEEEEDLEDEEYEQKEGDNAEEKESWAALIRQAVEKGGLAAVASLRHSEDFKEHMKDVEERLGKPREGEWSGVLEEDPEYRVITKCNELAIEVDTEVSRIHKYVLELYSKRFPGLDNIVPNASDYFKVVKTIQNESDLSSIDFSEILPSAQAMVVTMTGSSTMGEPLSDETLQKVIEGCDEGLALEEDKRKMLKFVEGRMNFLAPNLSILLGTDIAAQLVGVAGGLDALSRIPGSNIQVLGQKKRVLSGFSSKTALPHTGVVWFCDLVQRAPPKLRRKAMRVVCGRVALAARVDAFREHRDGAKGRLYRDEIEGKLEKLMAPPPPRMKKPLKPPDEKPRRKRGGRKYRKWKEKFGMTELRKDANRLAFGVSSGEYGDDAMGKTLGIVGVEGSGRIRVRKKEAKLSNMARKRQKTITGSSGATGGIASSLAFTPVQGVELMNPKAAAKKVAEANAKYFSDASGFRSAIKQ